MQATTVVAFLAIGWAVVLGVGVVKHQGHLGWLVRMSPWMEVNEDATIREER